MTPAAALLLAALPLTLRAQSPPALSLIAARDAAADGAVIAWTTDQAADAAVDYGLSAAYGSAASAGGPPGTAHAVVLGGLAPGTLYHYRVRSRGADGTLSLSGDFTFMTALRRPDAPPAAPAPAAAPLVLIMNPPAEAIVSGVVTVSANASAGAGVASVQFLLDGLDLAAPLTAPPFTFGWNTALAADGAHSLAAVARDAGGRSATSPIVRVTVDNVPPVISEVTAAAVSSNGAFILWKTNERADSQVDYGTTQDYGRSTTPSPALVVSRGVPLTDLAPATLYHYRVRSRDAAGLLSISWNNVFATAGDPGDVSLSPAAAASDAAARAPQKFLTPARADGVNDRAVFGSEAREVSIVDLRGRQVFHETSSGPPIVWNCRDGSGGVVPSGVYIASIVTRASKRLYQSFSVAK